MQNYSAEPPISTLSSGSVLFSLINFQDILEIIAIRITVNVLKFRTLKNNYFSAVRNFRNYVSEKVLVFVILECGL